jgi:F0F1-type ATP synthase assembly protein I
MVKTKQQPQSKPPTKSDPMGLKRQRQLFLVSALTMSWQLAIVVLVPIIGGHELDIHLKTSPYLTIVGFGLAALGTYGILRSVLIQFKVTSNKPKANEK